MSSCHHHPPDDGFLEAETYVGAFLNDFKETLYWFFLNKVHLVGDEISTMYISRNTVAHSLTSFAMETQQCVTFVVLRYICRQHCNTYRWRYHRHATMHCICCCATRRCKEYETRPRLHVRCPIFLCSFSQICIF
jgi:hypothetical protein